MKRTKIVATIGPVSDSPELIEALIKAGTDVFRFNMKHADRTWHEERIDRVREVCKAKGLDVGILIDLQGPEVRLETPEKKEVTIAQNELVSFCLLPKDDKHIVIPTPEVYPAVRVGQLLLIDDGNSEFEIIEVHDQEIKARSRQDCIIKHRKSVNFPGADIDLPAMTEDDYKKIEMRNMAQVDFVALSFTRTKKDVEILRAELDQRGVHSKICAKIENQIALDHLEEIVAVSDVVMVARGDLAVEIPYERLAFEQKRMIKMCNEMKKPVITATQMLHSMVHNMRPTRAEMCDVANAVYDGTDATMLSEESAGGEHPLMAVEAMNRILSFTETVVEKKSQIDWKIR
ncbi:MAG: pyruvate kinase [Candidatus Woesebacteria bacterium]